MSTAPTPAAAPRDNRRARRGMQVGLVVLAATALLAAMLRLAWIGDDAYVTLRVVENVIAGHGPVWNVGERVQVAVHPAWTWFLCGVRWLTGEIYFTTITASIVLASTAAALLARTAGLAAAPVVLLLLLGSRAFCDFATSGLETPLAMLLLVLLARTDAALERGAPVWRVAAVAAFLVLTRLDLVLIAAPVLLTNQRSLRASIGGTLAGLLPVFGWLAFALFYYGTMLPSPAYAKAVAHAVPLADMLVPGGYYFRHTLQHDPLTSVVVAAGIVAGMCCARLRARALATGVLLYCAFVASVGGDFMAGRFFIPPLLTSLAILVRLFATAPRWRVAAGIAALTIPFTSGLPFWLHPMAADMQRGTAVDNINNERRWYYRDLGLFSPHRRIPVAGKTSTELRVAGRTERLIAKIDTAGVKPFEAGELWHFVDPWILDPLLTRLPATQLVAIGHFKRAIPAGYFESLATGRNVLDDPGLRAFYADLSPVLRAPLASPARWRALRTLLLGEHDAALANYVAANASRRRIAAKDLPQRDDLDGAFWFDTPGAHVVGDSGSSIDLSTPTTASSLQVLVAPLLTWRFTFVANDNPVGKVELTPMPPAAEVGASSAVLTTLRLVMGFRRETVALPPGLPAFDRIDVDCSGPDILVAAIATLSCY